MKRLFNLLLFLFIYCAAFAQAIYSIDVDVLIDDKGDARITQVWDTESVDGTEWYIPIGNLGQMKIKDLTVSDENGTVFETLEKWDVDRDLKWKRNKCGIVDKGSSGVEVCWGKGSYGHHTHTVAYTATGLVGSFSDYDAFNFKFINDQLSSIPGKVSVTIRNGTGKGKWTSDNVKVWGFGFGGEIYVTEKGEVKTYNTEPLSRFSEVIVMCRFDKGLFHPWLERNRPFSEMFNMAMEGSDYTPPPARIDSLHVSVLFNEEGGAFVMEEWYACAPPGRWYAIRNSLKRENTPIRDVKVKIDDDLLEEMSYKDWKTHTTRSVMGCYAFSENKGGRVKAIRWASAKDGMQTFKLYYHLDDAVKNLSDCDGFCHLFINQDMNLPPDNVKLYIMYDGINPENTSIEFAGMEGKAGVLNRGAYVKTTDAYVSDESYLKVIVRFDDSVFSLKTTPEDRDWAKFYKGALQDVKASDHYNEADVAASDWFLGILLSLLAFFTGKKVWRKTGHVLHKGVFGTAKVTSWWRDIPFGGDMDPAAWVLKNGWKHDNPYKSKDLIGAYFLKWIQDGIVKVSLSGEGRKQTALLEFTVARLPAETPPTEKDLFEMAYLASGNNHILEKDEFNAWARRHYTTVDSWDTAVYRRGIEWFRSKGISAKLYPPTLGSDGQKEAVQLLGFKNYLSDFTLVSEREAAEVKLWKQYMIYATLFGIADKVSRSFKKLYPEIYASYVSEIGLGSISSFDVVSNIGASFIGAALAAKPTPSYSSSGHSSGGGGWSGGGGHTSFGGGGGYSGGGHGGGSR
ncbi:MAG: DUF2207 domain-containing protein [Bacteroidales bacterium]|nr:DUF2207 domain-containing protein [Bacteroidales bacterium]